MKIYEYPYKQIHKNTQQVPNTQIIEETKQIFRSQKSQIHKEKKIQLIFQIFKSY